MAEYIIEEKKTLATIKTRQKDDGALVISVNGWAVCSVTTDGVLQLHGSIGYDTFLKLKDGVINVRQPHEVVRKC